MANKTVLYFAGIGLDGKTKVWPSPPRYKQPLTDRLLLSFLPNCTRGESELAHDRLKFEEPKISSEIGIHDFYVEFIPLVALRVSNGFFESAMGEERKKERKKEREGKKAKAERRVTRSVSE